MRYCNNCASVLPLEYRAIDNIVQQGYIVWDDYFCTIPCIEQYTQKKWEDLYTEDGDNFYTEWELETKADFKEAERIFQWLVRITR